MHHTRPFLCIFVVVIICVNGGFAGSFNTTGCPECLSGWCPKGDAQCPLGLVEDICGCCPKGVCAKIEGEECYNSTLVPTPSIETKKYGSCGTNLNCIYKTDVAEWDIPYAICVCEDTRMVCSSNNVTYNSICDLKQEAAKNKDNPEKYLVQNYGPCIAIPVISTRPRDVVAYAKQIVVLSCEVRGYPIPTITWEFASQDNTRKKILPSDIPHVAIQSRGGPSDFMTTSWVQIIRLDPLDAGVYTCVAKNDLGYTKASARVTIRKINEEI